MQDSDGQGRKVGNRLSFSPVHSMACVIKADRTMHNPEMRYTWVGPKLMMVRKRIELTEETVLGYLFPFCSPY